MICNKGHRYPKEYDMSCPYCVAIFGLKLEKSKEASRKIKKYFKGKK